LAKLLKTLSLQFQRATPERLIADIRFMCAPCAQYKCELV